MLGLAGPDNNATLAAFLEQTGTTFPIAWDDGILQDEITFPEAISPYPRQVVLDRNGRIAYLASEHSHSDLVSAIESALND